ncbi:MAG: hypothetical protein J5780_02760 [Treponema sp.]|nr:hypothetical protein [Treponema sp.]
MKKVIHLFFASLCAASAFISCENFLDGGTFKSQLESDIAYAQCRPCEIRVECGTSEGQIMTESVVSKKVSDEFNVEFRSASGVYFLGWASFSKASDGTYRELSSDYVDFSDSVSSSGSHSVKAVLRKEAENICIKPVCMQVSPSPQTNAFANMPVQITFSVPVAEGNDDVFCYGEDNILIASGSSVLTDCFSLPAVSSDRKTVSLVPDVAEITALLKNSLSVNVSVRFGKNAALKSEKSSFDLSEKTFSVKYVPFSDDAAPEYRSLYARRSESAQEIIPAVELTEFSDDNEVHLRRAGKNVYVYGDYYDTESGIEYVCIREKLLNYKNGAHLFNPEFSKAYEYKKSDAACTEFEADDDGDVRFCIAHQMESEDGLVQLYVTVKDFCGNESAEKIITVIKNTSLSLDGVYPFNYCPFTKKNQQGLTDEVEFDEIYFNSELKTIKLLSDKNRSYYESQFEYDNNYYMKNTVFKNIEYGTTSQDPKSISLYCIYNSKKEKMSYDETNYYWYLELDVDSIEGLPVTVYAEDDIGNTCRADYAFGGSPVLSGVEQDHANWNNKDFKKCYFISNCNYTRMWNLKHKNGKWYRTKADNNFYANVWEENENDLAEEVSVIMMNGCLTGPFDRKVYDYNTTFEEESDEVPSPVIESAVWGEPYYVIKDKETPGCYPLIVKIREQDLYYGYDAVKVNVVFEAGIHLYNASGAFSEGSDTLVLKSSDFNYKNIMKYDMDIKVYGVKNNKSSAASDMRLSHKDADLSDTVPPVVEFTQQDFDNVFQYSFYNGRNFYPDHLINFCIKDSDSGIKSIYYVFEGKKYTRDISEEVTYDIIPVWDMEDGENSVTVYASDNKGNTSYLFQTVNIFTPPKFSVTDGTASVILKAEPSEIRWTNFWTFIYTLNSDGRWTLYKKISEAVPDGTSNDTVPLERKAPRESVSSSGGKTLYEYEYTDPVDLQSDKYVKVITFATDTTVSRKYYSENVFSEYYYNTGYSDPSYFYTGEKSTASDDVFFDGNNGVMVLSDKPVFINTYVTKLPYETCRNWDISEWNHKKRHINDCCMNFDSGSRTPKMYYEDTSDIEAGDCYVIAAHFADGTCRMSSVRQK